MFIRAFEAELQLPNNAQSSRDNCVGNYAYTCLQGAIVDLLEYQRKLLPGARFYSEAQEGNPRRQSYD